MKLSKWAEQQGITYKTALKWFHKGLIHNAYQIPETDSIFVKEHIKNISNELNVIYARVSNQSRKKELDYQVDRIVQFCSAKGIIIHKIYKEVASGMNDKRKEFTKMINSKPSLIIIENKDRLTRFGFNYLKLLLNQNNQDILIINEANEDKQDLLHDLTSIIYSFCARIYGLRRCKNKAKIIKQAIEND